MPKENKAKRAVIALGGNAITKKGDTGDIHEQFRNARESLRGVARMVRDGYEMVITHGNGPQIGNELMRVEMSRDKVPSLPLGVLVGDTEGGMGYMIEQCLLNVMRESGISGRKVATLVTQMLIDEHDPSMANPTKFVGPFFGEREAKALAAERGWAVREDAGRGYRRVVPSPRPLAVVNKDAISALLGAGFIVIAAGGGGIPVYIDGRGWHEGVDAVIDKDLASAVLGRDIGAHSLVILTAVDAAALNFGRPDQKIIDYMTADEAEEYCRQGHFPPGSMGPKIEAAVAFLKSGGKEVIITSPSLIGKALGGRAGTRIAG